jgi:SPP1 family predicted phage head-tail adaptor
MANLRGEYNKRVSFQNPTKTSDSQGGTEDINGYTTFLTTWAKVTDKGGNRDFDNGLDRMIDRKTIEVLYRASLASAIRTDTYILYDGKQYSIDRYSKENETKWVYKFETTGVI